MVSRRLLREAPPAQQGGGHAAGWWHNIELVSLCLLHSLQVLLSHSCKLLVSPCATISSSRSCCFGCCLLELGHNWPPAMRQAALKLLLQGRAKQRMRGKPGIVTSCCGQ